MSDFNERMHAFMAAAFYRELTERFGERGLAAFRHATQYYGEQRGRRMAQRAIRDGRKLDFAAYREYSEWAPTPEMADRGWSGLSETRECPPDLELRITRCPWNIQFREMGLTAAGEVYCALIDRAICRGFNPELTFDVLQTLNTSDHCLQVMRGACITAPGDSDTKGTEDPEDPKEPGAAVIASCDRVKDFEYHCAHIFHAYASVAEAVFGEEGRAAETAVLDAFAAAYGQDRADAVMRYKKTDFNLYRPLRTVRVVAAVIRKENGIFATARGYGDYEGWWEFPGGKVEAGETPQQALAREIREELDTEIEVGEYIDTVEYDYPEFHLSMACYFCRILKGDLVLKEAEDAKWLTADTLYSVHWLPADRIIVDAIHERNCLNVVHERGSGGGVQK